MATSTRTAQCHVAVVALLHIRSLEPTHVIAESLHPLTSTSPCPLPSALGSLPSVLWLCSFPMASEQALCLQSPVFSVDPAASCLEAYLILLCFSWG